MNSSQLSKRLETVAKYVPEGAVVADIGSDHAYLPCYLVKSGKIIKAIAGEIVEGPFQSAVSQVQEDGLTDHIEVRKGSGLSVISPHEVTAVTIAGMGGPLIADILETGKNHLPGVQRLILQPNISGISIRLWLQENGWTITNEEILEEDQKIYEVIVADLTTEKKPLNGQDLLFGPYLRVEKSAVFKKKWLQELAQMRKIKEQIEKAGQSNKNLERLEELDGKIRLIEEEIK
ncbi:tRNA (adenine(22)-N(1))-methyltransferase [Jeotgalibacillus aurantiacus]|uniref:tRNA (adenine(22)-N(1))-methyltransferase n=1 Tax=Jeotgalibacillus aurantiacus TaxID=2763266 RepID=UPI001D0BA069|nr:tRNA (adenine(22)-N(1))-methyltransferase TrmK [Jeotgalibacillus aurantiacus]